MEEKSVAMNSRVGRAKNYLQHLITILGIQSFTGCKALNKFHRNKIDIFNLQIIYLQLKSLKILTLTVK